MSLYIMSMSTTIDALNINKIKQQLYTPINDYRRSILRQFEI